jgi:LysM repeat protein
MESEDITHIGSSQSIAQDALQRGIAATRSGDREAAYSAFNEALASHAGNPELWVWLGATSPTLDQAEAAFERAYYLDPNNVEASMGIRWVRLRRKAATDNLVREPSSVHEAGAPPKRARRRSAWPWPALAGRSEASSWRRSLEAFVPIALLVLIAVMGAAFVTFSNSVGGPALIATATPVAQVAGLQGGDALPTPTERPTATKPRRAPTFTPTSTPSPSATPLPTVTLTPLPTDTPIPTATPAPPTATPPTTITYVVRPGDTLGTIAFRHGVTVDALRQANALTSDTLYVGQVLTITNRP